MVELQLPIKNLQEKLQILLKQQAHVQKENQQLQKELARLQIESKDRLALVQNLQQQVVALQIGTGNLAEQDKQALSKRIDAYLKEIDKCLSMLNS